MAAVLTKALLDSLTAKARREKMQFEAIDEITPGLRLRAGPRSAVWLMIVRLQNGKRSRVRLGSWPGMSVAEARAACHSERSRVVRGGDPNDEERSALAIAKEEARRMKTVEEALDLYEQHALSQLRRGTAVRRALDGKKGLLTTLGRRHISTLTRFEIGDLVKKSAVKAPIAANRKLAYASAFFNWCIDEGYLQANPVARMRKPAKENQRDRFHTLDELRDIWNAAGTLGYPFEQLYQLLIVLPMRRDEIAGIPVKDISLDAVDATGIGVWVLPSSRTKKANALRVPLSPLARSIIKDALRHPDRPQTSKFLFSTTGDTPVSGFAKAKRRLDAAIQEARVKDATEFDEPVNAMPHWTIHDLRTTFNTHACELLEVPPHVADRILNHVATATRSKIMRVYNKSELFGPRRKALDNWSALLCREFEIVPTLESNEEMDNVRRQMNPSTHLF